MASLTPIVIGTYDQGGGLLKNKQPFLLPNEAFTKLFNAYVWRDRVRKRQSLELLGRLRRLLSSVSIGNYTTASPSNTLDIFTGLGINVTEPDAELQPGSSGLNLVITFAAPIGQTLTDATGDGSMVVGGAGPITSAWINYATGVVTILAGSAVGPAAATITGAYFPSLPVMGIWQREISGINSEQTILWDTKYDYEYISGGFQQYSTSTWDGSDSSFFQACNYRGVNAYDRLMFVTNFNNSATVPMRYTNGGGTWTAFTPRVVSGGGTLLVQARILLPYYGRLIALNTIEGAALGSGNNFFNRCRFSQIGSPIATEAWDTDVFGRGGFIDAPTNEEIVSAAFCKNTLIVQFERSVWELRYQGEYGLPFIWERISSDFGCDSTFSTVLFDDGVLSVGDRAITMSNPITSQRIDLQIPDEVFEFNNLENGPKRVVGIRDYIEEMVFWCYSDGQIGRKFPNYSLLYNYRNNTYAIWRNNVTFYGVFQPATGITWNSLTVTWDDQDILWDDDPEENALVPLTICGNQKGFIHKYLTTSIDDPSLNVKAVTIPATSADPVTLNIPNHNLETEEVIKVTGLMFTDTSGVSVATDLNDEFYEVVRVDENNIQIYQWDANTSSFIKNYTRTPTSADVYIGGGLVTLLPRMSIITKDFNPYLQNGGQMKLSYIDFLFNSPDVQEEENTQVTVKLYVNSYVAEQSNVVVSQQEIETDLPAPYYTPGSKYSWHRFIAVTQGQFIRVEITYDDTLMASNASHNYDMVLNGMTLWVRPGSRVVF